MRLSEILLEANVLQLGNGRKNVRVWENPSAVELRNLIKRYPEMRGISTPTGVFIWDANDGLHWQIEELLMEIDVVPQGAVNFILASSEVGLSGFDEWVGEGREIDGVEYIANGAVSRHAPFRRMMRGPQPRAVKLDEIAVMATGANGTFWCNSATGEFVATEEGLEGQPYAFKHHSQDVKYHPEKYGLSPADLKAMPRDLPSSKKTKNARFDHDLMQWMMDRGWVRINSYGRRVEFQGSNKRAVQRAVGAYMDHHADMVEARVSVTPRLAKGEEMIFAELQAEEIEAFANRGIMPRATTKPFK